MTKASKPVASNTVTAVAVSQNDLTMDARVSFDDIVNISVSRYETELHNSRSNVQAEMKLNQANRTKLLTHIQNTCLNKFKAQHASSVQIGTIGVRLDVTVSDSSEPKNGKIQIDSKMSFTGPNLVFANSSYSSDSITLKNLVEIDQDDLAKFQAYSDEYSTLRDKLLSLNQQIQDIDRKTRQIKGLLAEKKVEAAGMSSLLNDPKIQDILQLK